MCHTSVRFQRALHRHRLALPLHAPPPSRRPRLRMRIARAHRRRRRKHLNLERTDLALALTLGRVLLCCFCSRGGGCGAFADSKETNPYSLSVIVGVANLRAAHITEQQTKERRVVGVVVHVLVTAERLSLKHRSTVCLQSSPPSSSASSRSSLLRGAASESVDVYRAAHANDCSVQTAVVPQILRGADSEIDQSTAVRGAWGLRGAGDWL